MKDRVAIVTDEDGFVGNAVEGEGRVAEDLEAGVVGKEKGFAASEYDLADGGGKVAGEVGRADVDFVVTDETGVAKATGGTALVVFGKAFEEDSAKGTRMKHDEAEDWSFGSKNP